MDTFENKKIAIIGAGHLAKAFIEGFIGSGNVLVEDIIVSNPSGSALLEIKEEFHVQINTSNKEAVKIANWILLAVKPTVVRGVIDEIRDDTKDKLIISAAACIDTDLLMTWCKYDSQKIVRIMPNIPVSINQGVIGFVTNRNVTVTERKKAISLLEQLGVVINFRNEKSIDVLTVLSACGPAIVAHLIGLISKYGSQYGLSPKISEKVILQTFAGTVAYLRENGLSVKQIEKSVATKGGITEVILQSMDSFGLQEYIIDSLNLGYDKIKILSSQLSDKKREQLGE